VHAGIEVDFRRPMSTVRSEIGPYRRRITVLRAQMPGEAPETVSQHRLAVVLSWFGNDLAGAPLAAPLLRDSKKTKNGQVRGNKRIVGSIQTPRWQATIPYSFR